MQRYTDRFSVGLTGGIGVGKTTVTNHFAKLGACIIDADEASRAITASGQPAVKLIAEYFGNQMLSDAQTLDRAKLRELVFNREDKKRQLEQLLHPLIRQHMHEQAATTDSDYVIFSIPLLVETEQMDLFDRILIIDAPNKLRIEWIKKRSGLSEQQIKKIIQSQACRQERLDVADDVIENDKDLDHLYHQVENLHQKYLQLAKQHQILDGKNL